MLTCEPEPTSALPWKPRGSMYPMLLSPFPHEYEVKSKRSPIPPKIVITPAFRGQWCINLSQDSQIKLPHEHNGITASTNISPDQWSPLIKQGHSISLNSVATVFSQGHGPHPHPTPTHRSLMLERVRGVPNGATQQL